MPPILLIFLVAVAAVALFVVGMSLTLIFKGHNIKSEISDNPNMRKLGIKCASQQIREHEAKLSGNEICEAGDCASCSEYKEDVKDGLNNK